MRRVLPAVVVTLGLAACSASSTDSVLGESQQGIADGDLDINHESVFALISHLDESGALCTGTLIAPNLILTARHCVSEGGASEQVICDASKFTDTIPGSAIYATNDAQPSQDSSWFQGYDVRVPAEGDDTCGFDIALVILDSNVPGAIAEPAVPRIDREVTKGETYVAVGYGVDDSGQPTGGRMRLGDLEVQCGPGDCGTYGVQSTEFLGETGVCSGDSGGPALDADGKVVGVVSRGSGDCDSPVYGTVTAWKDFIVDNAIEAAEIGGYDPPFWVLSGSSDLPSGEGGAPAGPAGAGDHCGSGSDCAAGYLCHTPSAPEDAVCRLQCEADSECADGEFCQAIGATGVCLARKGDSGSEDSGCAVAGGRGAGGVNAAWLFALVASALGAWRRRGSSKIG